LSKSEIINAKSLFAFLFQNGGVESSNRGGQTCTSLVFILYFFSKVLG